MRAIRSLPWSAALCAVLLTGWSASCRTPRSGARLHYEPRQAEGWTRRDAHSLVATVLGCRVVARCEAQRPEVVLEIENAGGEALQARIGPQVARRATAIGVVQRRRLQPGAREGRTDWLPYLAGQSLLLEPGSAAAWALDSPLGRDPALGDFFVLEVVLQGERTEGRCHLPLVATNVTAAESPARRP